MSRLMLVFVIASLAWVRTASAEPDADGCKDFYVSRLAGYFISECTQSDFDTYTFAYQQTVETTIEGKIVSNTYQQPEGATQSSPALVRRNYVNAFKAGGWTIVFDDPDLVVAKQVRNGDERWAQLDTNGGSYYTLRLAQKAGMQQTVVSADDMATALNRDGRISLHINFDTGKSTIKPDSQPIVDQIVALLKSNSSLQLSVEGHTDNVGTPQSNKTLSQARAQAVVGAVTASGIASARLTAAGFGQDNPLADNSNESGRAQNRRVDLVKK